MLRTHDLFKHFGGLRRDRRGRLRARGGREARDHRAERGGQDDVLPPHHRAPAARPGAGRVRGAAELTGLPPHRIVKAGLARSFQRVNVYPRMSVFENVQVALMARDNRHFTMFRIGARFNRDETLDLLALVGLAEEAEEQAGELAYGKQKQLELAIALAERPRVLLLDEPTAGMSPSETEDAIRLIQEIADARSLTLLFTEHDMTVVFGIADRITVLHNGGVIASGAPGGGARGPPGAERVSRGGGRWRSLSFATSTPPTAGARCCSASRSRSSPASASPSSAATGSARPPPSAASRGFVAPRRGAIEWLGENIAGRPSHRIAKLGIGYVPEERRIFPELTVWENLDIARPRDAGRLEREPGVRAVSGSGADPDPPRRGPVRRPAADADHRPGA